MLYFDYTVYKIEFATELTFLFNRHLDGRKGAEGNGLYVAEKMVSRSSI